MAAMELYGDTFNPFFGMSLALALSVSLNVWLLLSTTTSSIPPPAVLPKHQTFPQEWWTDPNRFQAERRAIFSQSWICVSHRGRFKKAGDYVVYDTAGFRFFMILGKDNVVRSFHNVCRHRAFPVARKDSGSATVLGCRYHGWSYNTKGELTKAPFFQDVPGFDKSKNKLFEILTREDNYGFLHINFNTSQEAADSSPAQGVKIGKLSRVSRDANFLHTFELRGAFNWKLTVNEEPFTTSTTDPAKGFMNSTGRALTPAGGELSFHPVTTIQTKSGRPFWYQIICSPVSAEETVLRCDVYSAHNSTMSNYEGAVKDGLEQELAQKVQGFEAVFARLRQSKERLDHMSETQAQIAQAVDAHLAKEKVIGKEIKPAVVQQQARTAASMKAEQICETVECGSETMEW
ncbi:hypothetical protein S40285_07447 [Stachybotrys chlorohalonatus IBT 40285]|uniref:Rieske domain-containing protein n=1 Tax=Stachybotrys chlorohalonatus (strain IBT 40285) TaxID=1283841 RepID=A0A084R115_STAC4|nr:hypothetical protein S40285_07447 [Stachybotrys chlorohalonata IBT 40285]